MLLCRQQRCDGFGLSPISRCMCRHSSLAPQRRRGATPGLLTGADSFGKMPKLLVRKVPIQTLGQVSMKTIAEAYGPQASGNSCEEMIDGPPLSFRRRSFVCLASSGKALDRQIFGLSKAVQKKKSDIACGRETLGSSLALTNMDTPCSLAPSSPT